MRRIPILLTLLLLLALAPPALADKDKERSSDRAKHVILVDWDGFDPNYLSLTPTPNLDSLQQRGSLSTARSTFHSVSNPARASMSTGAYPERHGNVAYVFDPFTNTTQGQSRFLAAQTINQSLAAAGRTTASVQWYMVQNYGTSYGDPRHLYVQPGGTFEKRVDAAIEILNRRPVDSGGQATTVPEIPDFMAVYSSDIDGLGHAQGPDSPAMPALIAEHDRQLGRLIQATKDVGIYDDTAFMLTSDHGMTAWNRTLIPQVMETIAAEGYKPEVVRSGNSPAEDTEVIIQASGVRIGDLTLRGAAASRDAERRIERALRRMPEVEHVLDDRDLRRLRASSKLGDLVVEARPPFGFATTDAPAGTSRGSHSSRRELDVPLFLAGAGVAPGARPRRPGLVDVAPTIAALLGERRPADAQGRALTESLERDRGDRGGGDRDRREDRD